MLESNRFGEQIQSLHEISLEIASLRKLSEVYDLALTYCLDLTDSEMGFIAPHRAARICLFPVPADRPRGVDSRFGRRPAVVDLQDHRGPRTDRMRASSCTNRSAGDVASRDPSRGLRGSTGRSHVSRWINPPVAQTEALLAPVAGVDKPASHGGNHLFDHCSVLLDEQRQQVEAQELRSIEPKERDEGLVARDNPA